MNKAKMLGYFHISTWPSLRSVEGQSGKDDSQEQSALKSGYHAKESGLHTIHEGAGEGLSQGMA